MALYSPAETHHYPQKRQESRDRTTSINLFHFLKGSLFFIRKQLSGESFLSKGNPFFQINISAILLCVGPQPLPLELSW